MPGQHPQIDPPAIFSTRIEPPHISAASVDPFILHQKLPIGNTRFPPSLAKTNIPGQRQKRTSGRQPGCHTSCMLNSSKSITAEPPSGDAAAGSWSMVSAALATVYQQLEHWPPQQKAKPNQKKSWQSRFLQRQASQPKV